MKRFICLLLCCCLLALTACSEEEAAQGVTDKEILVGSCLPLTGLYGEVGEAFAAGMRAYFKAVNDAGGIAGRTVKLVQYDDGGDAVQTILQMQRLWEETQVFGFVGLFGDGAVQAAQGYLEETGAPVVYAASGLASLYGDPKTEGAMLFPVQPLDPMEGRMLALRAAENGAKRIGVIYTNDDKGRGMLDGITQQVEALGEDISMTSTMVEPGQTDFSTAQIVFQNFQADAILLAMDAATFTTALQSFVKAESTLPMYASYVCATPETVAAVAQAYAALDSPPAVYANFWITRSDTAALQAFRTALEEVDAAQYQNDSFALAGYTAAYVFCEGLRRVGTDTLDAQRYRAAMEASPIAIPLSGEVSYQDGRRVGVQTMGLMQLSTDGTSWFVHRQMEDFYEILKDREQ